MKKLLTLAIVVAICGAGIGFWYYRANANTGSHWRTTSVESGSVTATIAATGTVEPEEVIDIGAQVVGRIERFGLDPSYTAVRDPLAYAAVWPTPAAGLALAMVRVTPVRYIDYGSEVNEGTVLAQLDRSLYQAQVDTAAAALLKAEADLLAAEAKLQQTDREYSRAQALVGKKAYDLSTFDMAKSDFATAVANIAVNRALIAQARAALKQAEINLGYCTITSPVKGVIIDRRVNIGQTVVASLTAPSLFLLAKDLKRMQIWASVNEADIGQTYPGQQVAFTVDAYPGVQFQGVVGQIRLNATMTQSVVTYTVVVDTDNSHGKLKPYLTANLLFVTGQKEQALLVPNAALRWRPQMSQIAPDAREAYLKAQRQKRPATAVFSAGKLLAKGGTKGPAKKEAAPREHSPRQERGTVWVAAGEFVRPVFVTIGLTDGTNTEIIGPEIHEHMELVIGEARHGDGGNNNNPLIPNMFGSKKKE
jgi:HlyD family secretion protein